MARTKPMNKAKARAKMLQEEVEITNDMDPEMQKTLREERGRRVAFKKAGEAMQERPKSNLLQRVMTRFRKKRKP